MLYDVLLRLRVYSNLNCIFTFETWQSLNFVMNSFLQTRKHRKKEHDYS